MTSEQRSQFLHKIRFEVPHGKYRNSWLHWWVKTYLNIHIPNVQVCPDHDAPFTAFSDAFFGRGDAFVCHGSRLFGGKTFLSAILGLTRAILLGAEVNILGGSEKQAKTMQRYMKNTHEQARGKFWEAIRAPSHMIDRMTATLITLSNGGSMQALPASETATRGEHGTDLYIDEADECDWEVFRSALGQTYEGQRGITPLTFITSTWQNADGTMTNLFDMVDEKNMEGGNWRVYQWCYKETHEDVGGHNTQKAIDKKRGEMTALDWMNEVELQRPAAGDLIFTPEIIEYLFEDDGFYAPKGEPIRDLVGHDYIFIPPSESESFYHGTDWAKRQDFTVNHTGIEVPDGPDRLAAWAMRQREPYPLMIKQHDKRVKMYGGPNIMDGTGIGDVISDFCTVEHDTIEFQNRQLVHEMYSSYIAAIESGEYRYPRIPYLMKKFQMLTREQVYEAKRNSKKTHTPDPFVAAAMAHKAKLESTFQLLLGRAY
jgi:hypothetical protein